MIVVKINKEDLSDKFLEDLHYSVFDYQLPASYFRYDLCMVVKNDEGELVTYALIKELTSDTVELAWGGTSKEFRGIPTFKATNLIIEECFKHYENVSFQTWNKNHSMIKVGLSLGFDIIGIRQSQEANVFLLFNKKRG